MATLRVTSPVLISKVLLTIDSKFGTILSVRPVKPLSPFGIPLIAIVKAWIPMIVSLLAINIPLMPVIAPLIAIEITLVPIAPLISFIVPLIHTSAIDIPLIAIDIPLMPIIPLIISLKSLMIR